MAMIKLPSLVVTGTTFPFHVTVDTDGARIVMASVELSRSPVSTSVPFDVMDADRTR